MRKAVVVCKAPFETLPPVMTVAIVLHELGFEVTVVCSQSTDKTKAEYESRGITVLDVCQGYGGRSIRAKASFWRRFHAEAWKIIAKSSDKDLVWVGSVDGALALGGRLLRRPFVLQALELYDTSWTYRKLMKRFVKNASAVVVPESCRAAIYRVWYDLQQTPFVLPNKPAFHPRHAGLDIEDERARNVLASLDTDKKIVLYQGHIHPSRELRFVAEGVKALGDNWQFVAMGPVHDNSLAALQEDIPELIHIPKILAPRHLQVTSHAYIGILTYSHTCLNNVFCAPNKIWEYSGFGLPMLCNILPPLQFMVQANGAGLCVNTEDANQVAYGLKRIDDDYETFSRKAKLLYESIDIHDIVKRITKQVSSNL